MPVVEAVCQRQEQLIMGGNVNTEYQIQRTARSVPNQLAYSSLSVCQGSLVGIVLLLVSSLSVKRK